MFLTGGFKSFAARFGVAAFCLILLPQNGNAVLRPQPGVTVNVTASELAEGGSTGEFAVVLKIRPTGPVAVSIGTSEQCDFSSPELNFTPDTWNIAQVVTVTANDDDAVEGDHDCSPDSVKASGADDFAFVTIASPVFHITDNDKVSLSISNISDGDEAGPQDSVLLVELSAPLPEPTLVKLTYGGTATGDGVDYRGPSEVTIPAGEMAVQVDLAVVDDAIAEPTETVVVSIAAKEIVGRAATSSAASNIADESSPEHSGVKNAFAKQSKSFLSKRLDFIASHGPEAQRLIHRNQNKILNVATRGVDISGVTVSPSADVDVSNKLWNVWMDGEFGRIDSHDNLFVGYAGADYLLNDRFTLGLMAEFDAGDIDSVNGRGWMVGPYLSAAISEHLFLDVRAVMGRSNNEAQNEISGEIFSGEFSTTRWLLDAKLAGNYNVQAWQFTPEIAATYGGETQSDYTVSNGLGVVDVAGQTVDLGRLAAGLNITYLGHADDLAVEPFIGAKLNWNFADLATSDASQSLSGSVKAGLNLHSENNSVTLSANYDGIGTDGYSSVSGQLSFSHQF